uniref:Uncharacterized protein n=1 Tax=Ascaris lumbricoides TaxID=6252 RepID=A0A9J2PRG7_ASCLU
MMSAPSGEASSSSVKKIEETHADSRKAHGQYGAQSGQRDTSVEIKIREMPIRPYKAPRWKSFRLPAAKYELLIYGETSTYIRVHNIGIVMCLQSECKTLKNRIVQLLITALVMISLKEIALIPWSKIEKLNAAIKKLNPAELTTTDAIMFANELLNATSVELPCALLKVPPRTVELLITALVMISLKEIALIPWSKIEKLNAAIKKLNPAELTTTDAIMFANELLNATSVELPCALLKVPPRTVEKCPGDKTIFDYTPLSKPSLFANGVVRGSQLLQAYKMMCCSGQSPPKFCPCGYTLFEGYCVALVKASSEKPFANISKQTCGPLGYVASSESMLTITLLEHISADFNARIYLDVFYSCATGEAYKRSDSSSVPFTSLLTSRCKSTGASAFRSFLVVANSVQDKSPNVISSFDVFNYGDWNKSRLHLK